MSKRLLMALLIVIFLITFSSCKRKTETPADNITEDETTAKTSASETVYSDEIFSPSSVVISESEIAEDSKPIEITANEEVVSKEEDQEDFSSIKDEKKKIIYEGDLSYEGYSTHVVVFNDHSTFTLPVTMTADDLSFLATRFSSSFPKESSLAVYETDGETVTVAYPEQSKEFISGLLPSLLDFAVSLLDDYILSSDEEEFPLYSGRLGYQGYVFYLDVYSSHSVLSLPETVSTEDLSYYLSLLREKYKTETSLITYSLEGNTLILYYPMQSDTFLMKAVNTLFSELKNIIDAPESESVNPEIMTKSQSQEISKEDDKIPEEVTDREEPHNGKTDILCVADRQKWVVSVALGLGEKYELLNSCSPFVTSFNLTAEAGMDRVFALGFRAGYDLSEFVSCELYIRYIFLSSGDISLYLRGGAGAGFGVGKKSGDVSYMLSSSLGIDYHISDRFSLYCEAGAEYIVKKGFGFSLCTGVKVTF